jgi:hypothetical protein
MTTISELEAQGWFISQEGIDLLISENPQLKDVNDFITAAKDVSFYFFVWFQAGTLMTSFRPICVYYQQKDSTRQMKK